MQQASLLASPFIVGPHTAAGRAPGAFSVHKSVCRTNSLSEIYGYILWVELELDTHANNGWNVVDRISIHSHIQQRLVYVHNIHNTS